MVDWAPPHGPWDDQLCFVYDGGVLPHDRVAALRPHDEELSDTAFVAASDAQELLRPRLGNRLRAALRTLATGCPEYLHDGSAYPPHR